MVDQKESVGENMSRDFSTILIKAGDTEPSRAEIKVQLPAGQQYAVLVREFEDGSHMVLRLFNAESERFSDLKTGAETRMQDILDTKEIMLTISRTNAPGIVIADKGEPIGVLLTDSLRSYFDDRDFTVRTRTLGDWGLAGDITVEAYRITCAQPGCGALNIVSGSIQAKPSALTVTF